MKTLLILPILLLFVGCQDSTPYHCNDRGYKGVVITTNEFSPAVYCSNGTLSPNKQNFITDGGDKAIKTHYYYEREDATK